MQTRVPANKIARQLECRRSKWHACKILIEIAEEIRVIDENKFVSKLSIAQFKNSMKCNKICRNLCNDSPEILVMPETLN